MQFSVIIISFNSRILKLYIIPIQHYVRKLEAVVGIFQIFIKYYRNREYIELLAKYVDDLFVCAKNDLLFQEIKHNIQKPLEVGSWKQVPDKMDEECMVVRAVAKS